MACHLGIRCLLPVLCALLTATALLKMSRSISLKTQSQAPSGLSDRAEISTQVCWVVRLMSIPTPALKRTTDTPGHPPNQTQKIWGRNLLQALLKPRTRGTYLLKGNPKSLMQWANRERGPSSQASHTFARSRSKKPQQEARPKYASVCWRHDSYTSWARGLQNILHFSKLQGKNLLHLPKAHPGAHSTLAVREWLWMKLNLVGHTPRQASDQGHGTGSGSVLFGPSWMGEDFVGGLLGAQADLPESFQANA